MLFDIFIFVVLGSAALLAGSGFWSSVHQTHRCHF
jgi:hypothetical protein